MSKDHAPGQGRPELRSWLARAVRFGLLDRLPREFDPDGEGSRGKTADYARGLLAALQDPGRRPVAEVTAEARRFRDWVEERLRLDRRRSLAHSGNRPLDPPDAPPPRLNLPEEAPEKLPGRPARREPREPNPMWDWWLDG